ncbi:MAG: acetyl-CoA acyltransferase [Myxococcota bacterium]|jgi:acetyl-CoA acyltransferase
MRRAVIVGGARTPFVRAFGTFLKLDAIGLGVAAVGGLLERFPIPRTEIDSVIWGGVILPSGAPNVGREIALDLRLPPSVEAYTVSRACASGLQAVTLAAAAIERGDADVVIAGGADSTSNARIELPASFVHKVAPVAMSSKSGPMDYLSLLGKLSPSRDLVPRKPAIAERSTGELMGEAAERMAERNGISRADQDAFAARSHHRAAAAISAGRFADELWPVQTKRSKVFSDEIVRADTSAERLAKLRPVFKKGGTLTAGNSSALTDGSAAVLMMSEDKARALGLTPLAAFKSWAYVGVDPADQLLMGPALAMPKALEKAGMALSDVDVVDMHEAFAAQVLAILKMLGSDAFARERLGRDRAVGEIDPEILNVHGGSVALGHPFGATGARMALTMAHEVHARGTGSTALLGICAAGGLGAGAVLEAV